MYALTNDVGILHHPGFDSVLLYIMLCYVMLCYIILYHILV